jgi:4-amino-4-deoxy-L-arabinose transferase-like glycosyltransferase
VLLVAALAVRIGYIEHTPYHAVHDAGTYNRLASMIAQTGDYDTGSAPGSGAGGSRGPTAYFPPGFPYFLAAVDLITGHQSGHRAAVGPERIAQAVAGTVTVGLVGLVALELFGGTAGLVCLALAAFYPVLIELSGTLVAENLMVMLELAAIWAGLRARRARHPYGWIAAAGVLTGLATLTHQNAILLLIPLAFAALGAISATGAEARRRARWRAPWPEAVRVIALLVASTALTIIPWTIRNAIELHQLVPVSDESGITLVGAYNPASAAFGPVPYKWRYFAKIPQDAPLARTAGRYEEVALGDRLQSQALSYIGDNPLSPLDVAVHNTLRMFELEGSYAWQASAVAMGLRVDVARTGVVSFWVVCGLALLGAFTAAARRVPRWVWVIPLLLGLSVIFINVETPRFREPIDPFLLLLAGCAVTSGLKRLRLGLRGAPVRSRRRAPQLASDAEVIKVGERLP